MKLKRIDINLHIVELATLGEGRVLKEPKYKFVISTHIETSKNHRIIARSTK